MKLWIPFRQLDKNSWIRLGLLAIGVFYVILIGFEIHQNRMLRGLGVDYLAFWSAGKVADTLGYPSIYDLDALGITEREQLDRYGIPSSDFSTIPMPLLSFFIIPFQFLSSVNVKTSYWIWGVTSLVVLIFYLFFFIRKYLPNVSRTIPATLFLLLILISFPVNQNFFYGQVEMLLVISAGEFIRNASNEKPIIAGVWLGALLLKPQLMILIIPALLLLSNWKTLSGFLFSFLAITGSSLVLSGFEGMKSMIDLWTRYLPGIASNSPENMMNFRMLGIHINALFFTPLGWIIAGVGIGLTLTLIILMVRKRPVFGSDSWIITMFGIFSATCAITWHSHNHMAMALIPFLVYAIAKKKLDDRLFFTWIFLPPSVLLGVFFLGAIMILGELPFIPGYGGFIMGLCGLAMNIFLTVRISQFLLQRSIPLSSSD